MGSSRARKASRCSRTGPVEDRGGGGARDVGSHSPGRGSFRAVGTAVPLDTRTADTRDPSRQRTTTVAVAFHLRMVGAFSTTVADAPSRSRRGGTNGLSGEAVRGDADRLGCRPSRAGKTKGVTMTADQVMALAGQVATWLTLVVVYLTLREMAEQRRYSYKPDLFPLQGSVFGYWTKTSSDDHYPKLWSDTHLSLEQAGSTESPHALSPVHILNLGVATANHVSARWTFHLEGILDDIRHYCTEHSIPVVAGIDRQFGWLRIEAGGDISSCAVEELTSKQDYVLPASMSAEGWVQPIPYCVHELTSLLVYLMEVGPRGADTPKSFREGLPVSLEISYRDLGGGQYKKRFAGSLTIPWFFGFWVEAAKAFEGKWKWNEARP